MVLYFLCIVVTVLHGRWLGGSIVGEFVGGRVVCIMIWMVVMAM